MKYATLVSMAMRRLGRALAGRGGQALAVGLVETLYRVTASEAPHGDIGVVANDELLADMLGWEGDPTELVDLLLEAGFVVPSGPYRLVVADWRSQCDDATRKRVRLSGRPFAGVDEDATPHVQEAEGPDEALPWAEVETPASWKLSPLARRAVGPTDRPVHARRNGSRAQGSTIAQSLHTKPEKNGLLEEEEEEGREEKKEQQQQNPSQIPLNLRSMSGARGEENFCARSSAAAAQRQRPASPPNRLHAPAPGTGCPPGGVAATPRHAEGLRADQGATAWPRPPEPIQSRPVAARGIPDNPSRMVLAARELHARRCPDGHRFDNQTIADLVRLDHVTPEYVVAVWRRAQQTRIRGSFLGWVRRALEQRYECVPVDAAERQAQLRALAAVNVAQLVRPGDLP